MKQKLWILWGIMGATALLALLIGAERPVVYGFTAIAALAGWIAFLLPKHS